MIKLMKASKRLGTLLADGIVRSIMGTPYKKHIFVQRRKEVDKLIGFIGLQYPNEITYMKKFVEESIDEFRELREIEIEKDYRPNHARFDAKAFVNLTDIKVPNDVALVLSFGPKFCFPPRENLESTITFLDSFCAGLENNFPLETHDEACKQLSIEINNENTDNFATKFVWLDFLNYRVNRFKKLHKDCIIMRSDKGKHVVLIDKNDYVGKMNDLVLSTNDYVRIGNVDVLALEQKNNNFVKILLESRTILSGSDYEDSCTQLARMYGLIKIHKNDLPVRPITSACCSPGFKLAKLLTKILSETFHEEGFHVKNSLDFVKLVRDIDIEDDELMISFDVVSMFTNIPIDLMVTLIGARAQDIFTSFNIEYELFGRILVFLLKECAVFQCNGMTFKQKDSLAMGSPLSPILAKILMSSIVDWILPRLTIKPKMLALYVDDSFWIVKGSEVDHILSLLNSYHPKIKFTVEKETNEHINFLDVTVIRKNGKLLTNWYKKHFASSRLLNYFSYHERTCIAETAAAYVRMVLNLSNAEFFLENRETLIDILRLNSFPETEIIGIMNDNYTLMKGFVEKERYDGKYIPIKFRGRLTQKLKYKIHPFLHNARLVGVPDRISSTHFSRIKDPIPINDKSNVVILFTCKCKLKHILRCTGYRTRIGDVVSKVLQVYYKESDCSATEHVFEKYKCFQRNSFSSTKRTFDMYAFAYKDSLIDTKYDLPIFRISKIINKKMEVLLD